MSRKCLGSVSEVSLGSRAHLGLGSRLRLRRPPLPLRLVRSRVRVRRTRGLFTPRRREAPLSGTSDDRLREPAAPRRRGGSSERVRWWGGTGSGVRRRRSRGSLRHEAWRRRPVAAAMGWAVRLEAIKEAEMVVVAAEDGGGWWGKQTGDRRPATSGTPPSLGSSARREGGRREGWGRCEEGQGSARAEGVMVPGTCPGAPPSRCGGRPA